MANVQISSEFNLICGGFPSEYIDANPKFGRTDVALNGSRDVTFQFQNAVDIRAGSSRQNVYINTRYTWNCTFDIYNNLTVNLRTEILNVTVSGWSGINGSCTMFVGNDEGSARNIGSYSLGQQSGVAIGYVDLGWRPFTLASGGQAYRNTLFMKNAWATHENEGCGSLYIDKFQGGVVFYNPNATPKLPPSISGFRCQTLNGNSIRITGSVNYANGSSSGYTYCLSSSSDFSSCLKSGSGYGNINNTIGGLQPNTKYYVKVTATNVNGSATKTCETVTCVPSTLTSAAATSPEDATVKFSVQYGGKVYSPKTTVMYRLCGASSWQTGPSSTTTTVGTLNITGLKDDSCYEAMVRTVTPGCTYDSNIIRFNTPKKGAFAFFNKIEPENVGAPTYETVANICYDYTAYELPATITVYYRVKDGYDPKWIKGDEIVVNDASGEHCFTLHDLYPNQTVYETYIHTSTEHAEWDGDISEFTTPLLPKPENHNCENLEYLIDLLCQAVTALPDGIKTIFANPTTKEICDPYSDNPTLATLWSRMLRFNHAAACLMCDMVDMALRSGKKNQYYAGEVGWVDLIDELTDEFEGNDDLVSSDAIYKYIQYKLHSVWHMHGTVDYLVGKSSELPSDAAVGSTAIVAELNQIWKKSASDWAVDQDLTDAIDDFSVYHINNKSDTSYGVVNAGSAYYQFGGTWNHLDADTKVLEERLSFLENAKIVDTKAGEDQITMAVVGTGFDFSKATCNGRKVYFVTEPLEVPAPGYHLMKFVTGEQATIIQNQDILDGATAQRPADPSRTGYSFVQWEDESTPGIAFNWSLPIKKDYTLVAKWDAVPVTVTFDLGGGTGTVPNDINTFYGQKVTLPDDSGFSRDGAEFAGWLRDGVPFTSDDVIVGNTTLVAYWTMDEFDVTIDPQNGTDPYTIHLTYGNGISELNEVHNGDNVFTGWYTSPNEGTGEEFKFNEPLFGPTTVYARWVPGFYTVTFDSAGGTEVAQQIIRYKSDAVMPKPDPTNGSKVFGGWMKDGIKYQFNVPITENILLVARWLETYTVKFVDSFGDTVFPDQTIVEGSVFSLTLGPAPDRPGYVFDGWYTSDGRKWNVETDIVTSNMTLTAIYRAA